MALDQVTLAPAMENPVLAVPAPSVPVAVMLPCKVDGSVVTQVGAPAALPCNTPDVVPAAVVAIAVVVDRTEEGGEFWGNWQDWKKAAEEGFEIGNHSTSHGEIRKLTPQALEKEINQSWEIIRQKTGIAPLTFVFPNVPGDEQSFGFFFNRQPADHVCQ